MGNSHSSSTDHSDNPKVPIVPKQQEARITRTASGADIGEKNLTTFVPVERLAEILKQQTNQKAGVNGIVSDTFAYMVFPRHIDLGVRLFRHLHQSSRAKTVHIGVTAFRQQCERFVAILDDSVIIEVYVRMFASVDDPDNVTPDNLFALLRTSFQLTMCHYSERRNTCPQLEATLLAVTSSCFFGKESLSVGFVCRWLEQHCPRLILPMHKYCVHTLTTSYRDINARSDAAEQSCGIELATPILENNNPLDSTQMVLPLSLAWLLAAALPPMYSKPQAADSPQHVSAMAAGASGNSSQNFLLKAITLMPSHWSLLYDTRQHGVGANRFLHHVLGYKGPTICFFRADNEQLYCLASPTEWRESTLYHGGDDCCILQISPKFAVIEKGPKMLYLNTCTRGHAKGLRAGTDTRKPIISVDEHFEKIDFKGVPNFLRSIEVWGCGDKTLKDVQLDIKKWQVKEAERQRTVKLTAADWMDHPDRYLLELGGRPQYNNSSK